MAKSSKVAVNPGIILVTSFLLIFAVNALVIVLANLLAPQAVVIGTAHITYGWALFHSMGTLALLNAFAIPFINQYQENSGKMFGPKEWMGIYFVINAVGLWLVTRAAEQLGIGVSSWFVVVVLAALMDVGQGIAMMQLEKYRTK